MKEAKFNRESLNVGAESGSESCINDLGGLTAAKEPLLASSAGRSRNMRAIRRRDTKPELQIRSLLHGAGCRFRTDFRIDLPTGRVRPDVVFTRRRIAVFVDGCFWHSCPEHGRSPSVNTSYWLPKLEKNQIRDQLNTRELEAFGWLVIRVWEHEEPETAAEFIVQRWAERASL